MALSPWQRAAKRAIDVAGASLALTLGAPVLAATAVAVARDLGRPVLFRQRRPGLRGQPFTLVKFRTMKDAVDRAGHPLPDADRLTRFGQRLRATSLDELPQFWNVLVGDMSLVGPRPLLMQYLPLYSAEQARRHDVKPGITGWAQVNGRNALAWEDKFALDVWYVDHQSLALDLRILLATVRAALARSGVSHGGGEVTMPVFTGAPRAA
ncbi:MAG: sugar transferase [Kofleriaceae bacterium]